MVFGPCFKDYREAKCIFESSKNSISVEAISLDNRRTLCVVPMLSSLGRLNFKLQLTDKSGKITETQGRHFYSCKLISTVGRRLVAILSHV